MAHQERKEKEWLMEWEAAEFLGVRVSSLYAWRRKGIVPVRPNPSGRGVLYDVNELRRIKALADRLAQLGIPSPVSAAVHGRVPVRWLTQLLGISRQRIYQLVPGSLTWDKVLTLLERRINRNPTLKAVYQPLKRWFAEAAKTQKQHSRLSSQ